MCVVWWWKVLESRGRGGGCVTGERRPRGEIEVKVGAVEEKLNAIMELLLRAAPAVPAAPPTESSSVELLLRDVSAVPAPPPASSSSALQAAEPTVAGASEAPDEATRNTKKSVMRKMSSKFS